jgi:hypothetical protein
MTPRKAIGFVTDSAPDGGYQLSQVVMGEDGTLSLTVLAYRSHLWELQEIEHRMKTRTFSEAAWVPPEVVRPRIHQPMPPPEDDVGLPRVVENDPRQQEHPQQPGLMDRLYSNGYNAARGMVPALFLAGVWLSTRLGGLV